ncbi:PWI domain-containing protein [Aulographum hederae CBS 113979]|uniref:PWI domain-containing protein n=1 Tax=Aulographum hederae CBS 113979 TaxID=1176131 RepID=A0A6G1H9B4_9PEZI|nr:PWI domain-containing protein [Aulographum hederae CBS 113979]
MAMTVDEKVLKATKFPDEFDRKVDMSKVKVDVIRSWAEEKLTSLLPDDEITVIYALELLLDKNPQIKKAQVSLSPFLTNKKAAAFCKEFWNLVLSAQDSPHGVPPELIAQKKKEIQEEKQKLNASRREQVREPPRRDRDREQEQERARGRDRNDDSDDDRRRGGRHENRRRERDSRSPPRRSFYRDSGDSYRPDRPDRPDRSDRRSRRPRYGQSVSPSRPKRRRSRSSRNANRNRNRNRDRSRSRSPRRDSRQYRSRDYSPRRSPDDKRGDNDKTNRDQKMVDDGDDRRKISSPAEATDAGPGGSAEMEVEVGSPS